MLATVLSIWLMVLNSTFLSIMELHIHTLCRAAFKCYLIIGQIVYASLFLNLAPWLGLSKEMWAKWAMALRSIFYFPPFVLLHLPWERSIQKSQTRTDCNSTCSLDPSSVHPCNASAFLLSLAELQSTCRPRSKKLFFLSHWNLGLLSSHIVAKPDIWKYF